LEPRRECKTKVRGVHQDPPNKIRVSLGSAVLLGLTDAKLDVAPTTAYLMTYREGKCVANCGFCPQARNSEARADMLSRVTWPAFQTEIVCERMVASVKKGSISRICIQTLKYPKAFDDLCSLVEAVRRHAEVPISVSCQPFGKEELLRLLRAGVDRIAIPLDAAAENIFDKTKGSNIGGPYTWKKQWQLLTEANEIFGRGRVSTHLISGLGETEREMVRTIQKCVDMAIVPALFAFTPIRGTALEKHAQPSIARYRRIQLARHLIFHGTTRCERMKFDETEAITDFGINKKELLEIASKGVPFLTSGCPNCNRPFYNEKPSGPLFNFPREPEFEELSIIRKQLGLE